MDSRVTKVSALIYGGMSAGLALLFLAGTYLTGDNYTAVARYGGAVWVFILAMVITMPIVIPFVKKRYGS